MSALKKHRARTLWLVGVLHAFTHLYQVALLPLYFSIRNDLKLDSIEQSTLLVTAMMISYFLPSYLMGILADKLSRKKLLATGLAINGMAFVAMPFVHSYPAALACVIVSGLGGSFYHPAATALIARLFPADTGKALGLAGIGASVGFFVGPVYAGWRASFAGWRMPVLELGIAGCIVAALFWILCDDEASAPRAEEYNSIEASAHIAMPMFKTSTLWGFFLVASFALSLRDFVGSSMGSLGSLFLQEARGFDLQKTGLIISAIFISSAISNPLFGRLSDGGRMRWATAVLLVSGALVVIFPHVSGNWTPAVLALYGFFFMASYPITEAALMESVHDSVRGRVFGLFISIGGFFGNLAHWLAGEWVKHLGPKSHLASGYYSAYALLGLFILGSLIALPCMHALRKREVKIYGPELSTVAH